MGSFLAVETDCVTLKSEQLCTPSMRTKVYTFLAVERIFRRTQFQCQCVLLLMCICIVRDASRTSGKRS